MKDCGYEILLMQLYLYLSIAALILRVFPVLVKVCLVVMFCVDLQGLLAFFLLGEDSGIVGLLLDTDPWETELI